MMKRYKFFLFAAVMGLVACNSEDERIPMPDAALEIRGIHATIDTDEARLLTRAEAAPAKTDIVVGRDEFAVGDKIVFTSIKRTKSPLEAFTYSNIHYKKEDAKWVRLDNDPEKIYWTDATSDHTFIGYSLPKADYHWEKGQSVAGFDTYEGELGYQQDVIDYTTGNDALKQEDLLLNHNTETKAETGGLSTKVTFTHALSNVCVVVNIKNFAASASAVDTQVGVSDMVLANQPTKYNWGIYSSAVQTLDFTNQTTKKLKLWCPKPAGEGTGQSKTFKFYGITTPQDETFHGINGNDKKLAFSFTVTYPDPMKPAETLTKTYSGEFTNLVNFNAGMCTTLNISLNHKDEQMFTGVQYSDWNYVKTPDLGELRKKTTFLNVNIGDVTIHSDPKATVDDATWLYKDGEVIKDIYGNDGTTENPYRISTAPQLLSFAKEVKNGETFAGKFIRLDADITMQKSAKDSTYTWNGIGDADHPFEGTFLGGDRYINRLQGKPLFAHLGEYAHVEQLQITSIGGITGGGALAGTNKGVIAACRVIDDVESTGGALVGTNRGTIYACYYTGTNSYKLIGAGSEGSQSIGCYEAKTIQSMSFSEIQVQVDGWNKALEAWYEGKSYTKYVYEYQPGSYPTVKPK